MALQALEMDILKPGIVRFRGDAAVVSKCSSMIIYIHGCETGNVWTTLASTLVPGKNSGSDSGSGYK